VNRTELQWLANQRIREARSLLDAQRWSGAYYLAGYAVECALKACIAKRMQAEEFPDKSFADKCWTHNLAQLLVVAELKADFDAALQTDTDLRDNWDIVKAWTEASRYARKKRAAAQDLYDAITDRKHGVLSWLKPYW
jgi:HEPN domain-containing protein